LSGLHIKCWGKGYESIRYVRTVGCLQGSGKKPCRGGKGDLVRGEKTTIVLNNNRLGGTIVRAKEIKKFYIEEFGDCRGKGLQTSPFKSLYLYGGGSVLLKTYTHLKEAWGGKNSKSGRH